MKGRDRKALDLIHSLQSPHTIALLHFLVCCCHSPVLVSAAFLPSALLASFLAFLASSTLSVPPPSLSKKCPSLFNQAIRSASIVRPFSPHLSPSSFLTSPPPRSFDPERETFHNHHKSQCRPCIIQNKDHGSQGALFPRSNPTGLTCLPSCTAYGPTPARSTLDRQLTFKVQYVF
jgi:hypothetical protein